MPNYRIRGITPLGNRHRVRVQHHGRMYNLGDFLTIEEAKQVLQEAKRDLGILHRDEEFYPGKRRVSHA